MVLLVVKTRHGDIIRGEMDSDLAEVMQLMHECARQNGFIAMTGDRNDIVMVNTQEIVSVKMRVE